MSVQPHRQQALVCWRHDPIVHRLAQLEGGVIEELKAFLRIVNGKAKAITGGGGGQPKLPHFLGKFGGIAFL